MFVSLSPARPPASWHLTAPGQKDYVRANSGACQGKMRPFHYIKKGVFGGKFQPTPGKCLIDESGIRLARWCPCLCGGGGPAGKHSAPSLRPLRMLKICGSERSSSASVPTVVEIKAPLHPPLSPWTFFGERPIFFSRTSRPGPPAYFHSKTGSNFRDPAFHKWHLFGGVWERNSGPKHSADRRGSKHLRGRRNRGVIPYFLHCFT